MTYIGILASPSSERLQLALRLTHPRLEEVELSQGLCTQFGISVSGVVPTTISSMRNSQQAIEGKKRNQKCLGDAPLMMLDPTGDLVLLGKVDEFLVVGEQLGSGLGDEDVHLAFQSVFGDRVVSGCVTPRPRMAQYTRPLRRRGSG